MKQEIVRSPATDAIVKKAKRDIAAAIASHGPFEKSSLTSAPEPHPLNLAGARGRLELADLGIKDEAITCEDEMNLKEISIQTLKATGLRIKITE